MTPTLRKQCEEESQKLLQRYSDGSVLYPDGRIRIVIDGEGIEANKEGVSLFKGIADALERYAKKAEEVEKKNKCPHNYIETTTTFGGIYKIASFCKDCGLRLYPETEVIDDLTHRLEAAEKENKVLREQNLKMNEREIENRKELGEMKSPEEVAEEIASGSTWKNCDSIKHDRMCDCQIKAVAQAIRAERNQAPDAELFCPGHYRCPKCNFYLVKSILHPNGISPDRSMPENCPNDGTEMLPITWKENAQNGREGQDRLMAVIQEKEEEIESLKSNPSSRPDGRDAVLIEYSKNCDCGGSEKCKPCSMLKNISSTKKMEAMQRVIQAARNWYMDDEEKTSTTANLCKALADLEALGAQGL